MIIKKSFVLLFVVVLLALINISSVSAQEADVNSCSGDSVTGQVVSVNEADGTIMFYTADGYCTVSTGGELDHPVVNLLGKYFSDVNIDDMLSTLEPVQSFVVFDEESQSWILSDESAEGVVAGSVLGVTDLGDGTFEIVMQMGDEIISMMTDDVDLAAEFMLALEENSVSWDLRVDENGMVTILDAGGQIADYHDSGMGLGVLVKLFEMANSACDDAAEGETCVPLDVDALVSEFESGTGLGVLFKDYGKPENTGVGQIFKSLDETPGKALGLTKQEQKEEKVQQEDQVKANKSPKEKNENSGPDNNNGGGKKK